MVILYRNSSYDCSYFITLILPLFFRDNNSLLVLRRHQSLQKQTNRSYKGKIYANNHNLYFRLVGIVQKSSQCSIIFLYLTLVSFAHFAFYHFYLDYIFHRNGWTLQCVRLFSIFCQLASRVRRTLRLR